MGEVASYLPLYPPSWEDRFRPALQPGSSEERLHFELTTLPAHRTILASALGLTFGIGSVAAFSLNVQTYPLFGMNATPAGLAFMVLAFQLTLWI